MKEIFAQIKGQLGLFNTMYDLIRIVDPVKKIAYLDDETTLVIDDSVCYQFWKKGAPCDNCISMRAIENNKATTKIEVKEDVVYLVQAVPMTIGDEHYVVEILKDITADQIFYLDNHRESDLNEYIKKINLQLVVDPLTNVYNRRYIDERFASDLSRIGSNGKGMMMAICDIDYFKQVNDNYGHLAGDHVLKEVTRLLKESIRENSDWVARYGGEEFLVVFNAISPDQAGKIIEGIRKKIAAHDFIYEKKVMKITCSFGLVAIQDCSQGFNELFEIADKRLYQAKSNGRNRCVY